jgi:hypothetical protein
LRLVRLAARATVGAKRNAAAAAARGAVLLHWDDDDLYGPGRVEAQAEPLLRGEADLTVLTYTHVSDLAARRYLRATQRIPFWGSLAYRAELAAGTAPFADINVGEDVHFAEVALDRCAHMQLIDDVPSLYTRHGPTANNTWRWGAGAAERMGLLPSARPELLSPEGLEEQHRSAADDSGTCTPAREGPAPAPARSRAPDPPSHCPAAHARQRRRLPTYTPYYSSDVQRFGCSATLYNPSLSTVLVGDGFGCTDPTAVTFNPNAYQHNCELCYYRRTGCTDSRAFNFNPAMDEDDGSCLYNPRIGCTAPTALNYDSSAQALCVDCCRFERLGRTEPDAANYNSDATTDDSSCVRAVTGCLDPSAVNFNSAMLPARCTYRRVGCLDSAATNYMPDATDPGPCTFLRVGCTDPNATGFDPDATLLDPDACGRGGLTPERRTLMRALLVVVLGVALMLALLLPCTSCPIDEVMQRLAGRRVWLEERAEGWIDGVRGASPPTPPAPKARTPHPQSQQPRSPAAQTRQRATQPRPPPAQPRPPPAQPRPLPTPAQPRPLPTPAQSRPPPAQPRPLPAQPRPLPTPAQPRPPAPPAPAQARPPTPQTPTPQTPAPQTPGAQRSNATPDHHPPPHPLLKSDSDRSPFFMWHVRETPTCAAVPQCRTLSRISASPAA